MKRKITEYLTIPSKKQKEVIQAVIPIQPKKVSIFSWNVENLPPLLTPKAKFSLQTIFQHYDYPDIFCLQEVRLRKQDRDLIQDAKSAIDGYKCNLSLPRDARNVKFRGGRAYGVATYVKNSLQIISVRQVDWDKEGRILITELDPFIVINVYLVNGTEKPYYDPDTGAVRGTRNDFKRRFNMLLMEECKKLTKPFIIIGDINISPTKMDSFPRLRTEASHTLARSEFNEIIKPTLGVVDIFRHLHPNEKKYTWYNKIGKDAARVDYALVSGSLLEKVEEADIKAKQESFNSDHVPLFVTIKLVDA
jgi:exodeoxyribonuclease III